MRNKIILIIFFVVILTLIFQLFHFAEHLIQLVAWLGGFRNMPYMSPWATELVWLLGESMVPGEEDYHRIFMVGVELLHLIGNAVFLVGTFGLYWFLRNKLAGWALILQAVHVFEHIMLFFSAYYIHQSIGMSTAFGYFQPYGTDLYDQAGLTTLRVWWHFIANLIPSVLVGIAVFDRFKKKSLASTVPTWAFKGK